MSAMSEKQNDNPSQKREFLQGKIEQVLYRMNQEGDFKASIISTLDGFSFASVSDEFDDVKISAISAIVQDVSKRAEKYIGFKRMDEVSLVDDDKFRLVCREFLVGGSHFILTVVVPPYKAYRRITNVALKNLEDILQEKHVESKIN